jgi:hypothetical protein
VNKPHQDAAETQIKALNEKIDRIMRGDLPYGASNANLYLALEKPELPQGRFQRVLHALSPYTIFRLKPFGDPLDPMAQNSLYFAAGLMTAIFILEFVGWSLLLNEVLNAGVLRWSWYSVAAVYFGLLFGFAIVALEQAILTADTTRGWGKLKATIWIRIVLIGASAIITTQPYELLFFSSEVKDRVHQESIRAEMVLRYPDYRRLNYSLAQPNTLPAAEHPADTPAPRTGGRRRVDDFTAACPPAANSEPPALVRGADERDENFEARKQEGRRNWLARMRDSCEAARSAIPARIQSVNALIAQNQAELTKARSGIDSQIAKLGCNQRQLPEPDGCAELRKKLRDVVDSFDKTRKELQADRAALTDTQGQLEISSTAYENQLKREFNQLPSAPGLSVQQLEEAAATPEAMRSARNALNRYLTDLTHSKPGEKVALRDYRGGPPIVFQDQEYGITNKVRVLYTELLGGPYQWPGAKPELIDAIMREFPLTDPPGGSRWYRWLPWGMVLLASMFLPFVSLGYKRTLNENLNLYYVTEYQEQLGHVGATVSTEAARRFRERREGEARRPNGTGAAPPGGDGSSAARFSETGRNRYSDPEPPFGQEDFSSAGSHERNGGQSSNDFHSNTNGYGRPPHNPDDRQPAMDSEPEARNEDVPPQPQVPRTEVGEWKGRSARRLPPGDGYGRSSGDEEYRGYPVTDRGDGYSGGGDDAGHREADDPEI